MVKNLWRNVFVLEGNENQQDYFRRELHSVHSDGLLRELSCGSLHSRETEFALSEIAKTSPGFFGLNLFLKLGYIAQMEYVLRIWKFKRPRRDDDDDFEYIIGAIIVFFAVIVAAR
jgi:hypothetical protein